MGTFRLILAMAVLISHIATSIGSSIVNRESTHILVWSGNAVFAFFIISGFYMSLIINTRYGNLQGGTLRFYLNRALRLYPIQWVLLAMYAAVYAASGTPSFLLGDARDPLWRCVCAVLSNVFLLGSEVPALVDGDNWGYVVGPIWSLSIEMYFYLLAPFIVGRSLRTLLTLCGVALAFRLTLYASGLPVLPWRYFFFPADLVFFLIGSASYHLYVRMEGRAGTRKCLGAGAAVLLAGWVVTPQLWMAPDLDQPLSWAFYAVVVLCTPLLFDLTRSWKFDNVLGQLSYPIYLSHVLVIGAVKRWDVFAIDKGVTATLLTLALATGLYVLVDRPVERIRRRIGSIGRGAGASTALERPCARPGPAVRARTSAS